jgi:Cu(I)/Ag(I) efflux system membrane protein CusA/SilA
MYVQGVSSNIMSHGGIAIAIGAMVDAVLIMIENALSPRDRFCNPVSLGGAF